MDIAINGICGQMGRTVLQVAQQENAIDTIYGVDIKKDNLGVKIFKSL